jgi:hypothetical protein
MNDLQNSDTLEVPIRERPRNILDGATVLRS